MPIPFIIMGLAALAGTAGVASGAVGAKKIYDANEKVTDAKNRHKRNISRFNNSNEKTTKKMDELGKQELEIVSGFKQFSDLIEKIQNRPVFKDINIGKNSLPKIDLRDLRQASVGAGAILGGLGGAAVGTAGGFAAAGATTAAMMALGTASTGTAISALSGAAATNAALAALGGGSLAAGGGGVALGTAVLGGATLGVGLLIGGVIFNVVGGNISEQADKAYHQMLREEKEINRCCCFLDELYKVAVDFSYVLRIYTKIYDGLISRLNTYINDLGKTDWNEYSDAFKRAVEILVLLVQILFNLCKTSLVKKSEKKDSYNEVQESEVYSKLHNSYKILVSNRVINANTEFEDICKNAKKE